MIFLVRHIEKKEFDFGYSYIKNPTQFPTPLEYLQRTG